RGKLQERLIVARQSVGTERGEGTGQLGGRTALGIALSPEHQPGEGKAGDKTQNRQNVLHSLHYRAPRFRGPPARACRLQRLLLLARPLLLTSDNKSCIYVVDARHYAATAQTRSPAGNPRPADSPHAASRTETRMGNLGAHPAALPGCAAGLTTG